MIRAVIFDLDGVLVRTDQVHLASWQTLAAAENIPFDAAVYDARMRGVGRMHALEVLLEQAERAYSAAEKERLAAWKNDLFLQLLEHEPPRPAEGALPLLASLRDAQLELAVASSSRNARLILEVSGLAALFTAVTDGHCEPSKPHPRVFLQAAEELGVEPAECIAVEDSVDGVEAVRRAGMRLLAIGPPDRFPGVRHCWPSLAEVTRERLLAAGGE